MEELMNKLNQKVEESINEVVETGIQPDNIEKLYKLVDIHKDIANEQYWKEDNMRYGAYGNYGEGSYNEAYGRRGVAGTGRGRYSAGGNYGRRGVDAKYRGEEAINDMYEAYGDYMDNASYGSPETAKALKYMLKSAEDFFKHIQEEAQSPEEIEMVKETAKKISMM